MEHFHEHDHVSTWRADMMRAHLSTDHGVTPPMSWEVGRLHRFHLEHHQTATECGAYYGVGDGTAATCRRPKNHPEISQDGIGHSPQPIPIQTQQIQAEEAPMTDTLPNQRRTDRTPDADDQEHRVVILDRLVAAMAGLHFERDWAADDGIGPNGRGALRNIYKDTANRLMEWMERGGLTTVPGYLDLINQRVLEERDYAQRIAAEQAQTAAGLRTQMREQQKSLEDMAGALAVSASLVEDMEETNNGLRSQLRGLTEERDNLDRLLQAELSEKDRLFEQMDIDQREHGKSLDAVQRELATARAEEDRLRGQLAIVINERDATRDARSEAEEARDRAQQALMAKLTEAGELRAKLDQVRLLAASLADTGWEGSTVYERLATILADAPIVVTGVNVDEIKHVQLGGAEIGDAPVTVDTDDSDSDLLWAKRFAAGEI